MRHVFVYSTLCAALLLGGCGPSAELEEGAPDSQESQDLSGKTASDPSQLHASWEFDQTQTFCGMTFRTERASRPNAINVRITRYVSKVACDDSVSFKVGNDYNTASAYVSTNGTATDVAKRISLELNVLKHFYGSVRTVTPSGPNAVGRLNEAILEISWLP